MNSHKVIISRLGAGVVRRAQLGWFLDEACPLLAFVYAGRKNDVQRTAAIYAFLSVTEISPLRIISVIDGNIKA